MPDKKKNELEDRFPDLDAVDSFLGRRRENLMDVNHKIYTSTLREAERLDDYRSEMNLIIEDMQTALAVGAMLTTRRLAMKIQEDYGLVLTEELAEDEEEEEEEEEASEEGGSE